MKKPKPAEPRANVLIVDDEYMIQELLSLRMKQMGLKVCGRAATADHAIELAKQHRPEIVLMDVRLQGERDGVDAALGIHACDESSGSKIIYITGSREPKTMARIQLDSPTTVLFKPIADSQLQAAVENALYA